MMAFVVSFVWCATVCAMLAACAVLERRARLVPRADRPEWLPPRAPWGGERRAPTAHALAARGLAGFARLVRSRTRVEGERRWLRRTGQLGGCLALAVGLAMIPFASIGRSTVDASAAPISLAPLDLDGGLLAILASLLFVCFARVVVGLSERNLWSRLSGVRQASRAVAALALLVLVLAPLVFTTGSLRLQDIVAHQQGTIVPLAWLADTVGRDAITGPAAFRWPAWNLFVQPLTALLFGPALVLMLGDPRIDTPASGAVAVAGIGLDADVRDLYWFRLETRLVSLFGSALFVALFLGAGAIPFVTLDDLTSRLAPFVGIGFATGLFVLGQLASFAAKWLATLALASYARRAIASGRDDQSIRLATRRLLPLAWANLLLVASLTLLGDGAAS